MEYVFEKEDLWDCIKTIVSEEKISASGDTASNLEETRASESTRIPATRQELEILCKRRWRALGILKLSLAEGPQDFIADLKDPKIAWKKLEDLYQTHTLADIMVLRNKRSAARMTDNMDVPTFMQLIYGLMKELRATG